MTTLTEVRQLRSKAFGAFEALATKDVLSADEEAKYGELKTEIKAFDDRIARMVEASELAAKSAQPVAGQDGADRVYPSVETDPYVSDEAVKKRGIAGSAKSLLIGGVAKMLGAGNGSKTEAAAIAKNLYGESHPVTKALNVGTGSAGGFIVPPDVMNEVIPLLRAKAVVRGAGGRNIPMPRGTMTLPGQRSAATASYGSETRAITQSQQTLGQIVASFKKLTALVPVTNDMMRYADPAVDAFVRDDLVKVMALREDLAFLMGDGTQDTPRGFLSFANGWVSTNGGTVGNWSTTGNSTYAANGTDPANSTGGNFVTSNASYTLATAASELGGAVNRLDQANVPDDRRVWFFNPRIFNYLYNVQNSLGVYVYRDELVSGTLLGYPFRKTTQIGTNYRDTSSSNTDLSFIFLVEMTEDMIFDSMQLELAVSREGSYIDSTGATISAFQQDQTVIRAIAEHDHQLRHDASVAVIQAVRWAPAIS